ncbi:hypothetical protein [Nocardia terpenica]|uniref:WXG100-like domain-containing protein n=1 Tax=Nocardia terpenica TaxID=455432 RepID=UPI002FE2E02A
MPVIVCRGDEYHSAGEVFGQMSTDAVSTHSSLVTVLAGFAGMAGSDSVGQQWAASYNEAAQLAISTSSKLATALGQVRDLIVVGAHNHQVAETAAHLEDLPPPQAPQLLPPPCLAENVPSAAGSGIPEPFGWSIIKDAVGWAWPNGHQDQLNAAQAAWHTAAADFRTVAGSTPQAVELLRNQQSTEIEIAVQTCNDRQADLNALADACQTLGDACGNYAHHLDEAHEKIIEILQELAIETAVAETAFAALAPVTGTLSEWIGNGAMAARVTVKARRVATIIGELATKAAKIVVDAIKPLVERLKPLFERIRKWAEAAKTKLSKGGDGLPGRPGSGVGPSSTPAEREALIQELDQTGIKFNPEKIVQIGKDSDGKVIFLEQGNDRAGLQHVLKHAGDFANKGVREDEIPEVVLRAVTEGERVGVSGRDRPIFEIMHNGQLVKIAVTVGSNGFIVGANPIS